jgi:hypothetical protein
MAPAFSASWRIRPAMHDTRHTINDTRFDKYHIYNKMTRQDFFRKIIRYLLLLLLTVTAIFLGKKAVAGGDCSSCPGRGICKGDETDCSKFLSVNDGRASE